jgi:hypothetical protein
MRHRQLSSNDSKWRVVRAAFTLALSSWAVLVAAELGEHQPITGEEIGAVLATIGPATDQSSALHEGLASSVSEIGPILSRDDAERRARDPRIDLLGRLETRRRTVERKSALVMRLKEQLAKIGGEAESEGRRERLAWYAWVLFSSEGRRRAELMKIVQLEEALRDGATTLSPELRAKRLAEQSRRIFELRSDLLAIGTSLRPLVTTPFLREQLDLELQRLREEAP